MAVAIVFWASPVTDLPDQRGTIVGAHQRQREDGQGALHATVTLENGQLVDVVLPRGVPILRDREVVLAVRGRDWLPERRWYRFKSYADEASPSH